MNDSPRSVSEKRQTPVSHEVDVLVAGGGIAGMFAAVSAARMGARTLVVDRFGALGGNMGPGNILGGTLIYFNSIFGGPPALVQEFHQRLVELRGRVIAGAGRESNAASYIITKMFHDAGGEAMLSTYVCDPIVSDGTVRGVFVENKSGRRAIMARTVLDASGEADVCRRAGAPMLHSTDPPPAEVLEAMEDLKPHFKRWSGAEVARFCGFPSMGCGFAIAGIDVDRARQAEERGEGFGTTGDFEQVCNIPGLGPIRFDICRKAGSKISRSLLEGRLEIKDETMEIGKGHMDAAESEHISQIELHARLYLFEMVEAMRVSTPGFEEAYLLNVAPYVHCRGGTCIDGELFVTAVDMLKRSRFNDVIFIATLVDDGGRKIGPHTDVPYRSMLPRGLDGVLAIGRSASHRRLLRTRPNCMLYGITAGIAGAMAAAEDTSVRGVNMQALQRHLLDRDVYLGDDERLGELGL